MIALRTSAACGHCPLGMTCLRGKPIVFDQDGAPRVQPINARIVPVMRNVLNVVMCTRCAAVFFQWKTKRFICELLRRGHHPMSVGQAKNPTAQVRAAMGGYHETYVTNGCKKYFFQHGGDCFEMHARDIDVTY